MSTASSEKNKKITANAILFLTMQRMRLINSRGIAEVRGIFTRDR
jgi:hypothetical protein